VFYLGWLTGLLCGLSLYDSVGYSARHGIEKIQCNIHLLEHCQNAEHINIYITHSKMVKMFNCLYTSAVTFEIKRKAKFGQNFYTVIC